MDLDLDIEEGNKDFPLANSTQRFFVEAGYRINWMARWSVRQIGHLCMSPMPERGYKSELVERVGLVAKLALALPFSLALFALSTPCYLLAAYVGTGRFKKVEAKNPPKAFEEGLKISFQNICGQHPWSIFSGGVIPPRETPREKGPEGKTRTDRIIEDILKQNPDSIAVRSTKIWIHRDR